MLDELRRSFGLCLAPLMSWTPRNSNHEIKIGTCLAMGEMSRFFGLHLMPLVSWVLRVSHHEMKISKCRFLGKLSGV